MHFLLSYEVAADYLERRATYRADHLQLARAAVRRGELVLGGAFDPAIGTALLFRGDSPAAAEAFAEHDPYVRNGLVKAWKVQKWTTVIGPDAQVRVDEVGAPPRTEAEMDEARLVGFLRTARMWTVASVGPDGAPQSAVVGVAVGDDLSLVFDTLQDTRKAANLTRDPRISLVMWAGEATAQIEGTATVLGGAEDESAAEAARQIYFETFPDGRERAAWDGIRYVRVRPTWIRISDFSGASPTVLARSLPA